MKMQINSLTLDSVLLFGYNSKPTVSQGISLLLQHGRRYKNVNFNVDIMKKYIYICIYHQFKFLDIFSNQ